MEIVDWKNIIYKNLKFTEFTIALDTLYKKDWKNKIEKKKSNKKNHLSHQKQNFFLISWGDDC